MNLPALADVDAELARRHLLDFTAYTYPGYQVNWHHELIAAHLDDFVTLCDQRLMIFVQPRAGKSELVSRRLPAFILGRDPDAPIIATSYGADLARSMNRDVQRIIDSDEYGRLFPDTRLWGKNVRSMADGSYLRNSDMFEVVGHRGYYLSAGVGGPITGRGARYMIIDDPSKNRKEASSPTYQQAIYEWYTSTFYTRLAPGGNILIVLTRWHELDLAGRLLAAAAADPHADQWAVITLPAVAEEPVAPYDPRTVGDVLWPTRWDAAEMRRKRAVVGERDWASLYQQRPSPDEGEIFKRHHWRYWQPRGANLPPVTVTMADSSVIEVEAVELPARFDELLQSWDCTFKDTAASDFVAGQVLGRLGADKFLLDYICERLGIVATMDAIRSWRIKWPKAIAILIEDKANGPAVIQMLHKEIAGLIAVEPQGGKVSRAYAAAPEVESGNVYLPHPLIAPWVGRFIGSAAAFPNAAHDDDVDAFTQAIIRWQEAGQMATAPAQVTSQATIQEMFG
jgi:predicted phage terminase large subunit-like protein